MRVLVVDDDGDVRRELSAEIAQRGHDVECAEDGEAALSRLVASPPFDLVLTDVRMPRVDGFTVLRRILRDHPETAVVVMTSFAQIDDVVFSLGAGAVEYLEKPFALEALGRLVEAVAARRGHGPVTPGHRPETRSTLR